MILGRVCKKLASSEEMQPRPYKYYSCHTISLITASAFICWGSYLVYDIPGELFYPLQKWFGPDFTDEKNLALYSAYSWPTVILAFCGGYAIDKLSVRTAAVIFAVMIILGQFVFTVGVISKVYWVCIVGRLVLGSGSEAIVVAQNAFVLRWFGNGPAVATIFGVLTFIRASSAIGYFILPPLADSQGIPVTIWVGTVACGISCLLCMVTAVLDKLAEPILRKRQLENSKLVTMSVNEDETQEGSRVSLKQIREFPARFWVFLILASCLLNSFWSFGQVASYIVQNMGPYANSYDQLPAGDISATCIDFAGDFPSYFEAKVERQADCEAICSGMKNCSGYQHMLLANNSSNQTNCLCFSEGETRDNLTFVPQPGGSHPVRYGDPSDDAVICMKREHEFSPATASMFAGLPNFVTLLSPLCGMFVDRHGRALYTLMLGSGVLISTYVGILGNGLGWFSIHPVVLMVWGGFGLTFALAVAEPTISVIIPPNMLGTAYGCYVSATNLFSAVIAQCIGAMQDSQAGSIAEFTLPLYAFIFLAAFALVLCVVVLLQDKKAHHGFSPMNASIQERTRHETNRLLDDIAAS